MALSHQWFVQWTSPSMVIADINNQYNSVNNWNNDGSKWSRDASQTGVNDYNNYGTDDFDGHLDYTNDGFTKTDKFNTQGK